MKRFRIFLLLSFLSIFFIGTLCSCSLEGSQGIQGEQDVQGDKGETGNGISCIEKTKTEGLVDTYTITFTNGTTTTFTVTNGSSGKSVYEIYIETHPEYTKSEEEWIQDLINGELITNMHKVIFNSDGGNEVDSQYVLHGYKVTKPENPTRLGYTFDGWYIEDEKWVYSGYPVTEDITLTAHWIQNEYNLVLNNNGNQETYTVYYNDQFTLPTFDKSGYVFEGWFDDQNIKYESGTYTYLDDLHLTAKFRLYQVTFDTNGGNEISKYETNKYVLYELPIPERAGYIFCGWYYNDELVNTPFEYNGDVTLIAKWIDVTDELGSAQYYLKQMYEKTAETTPADYLRPGIVAKCTVEWTVEVTSGNAEDVKVIKNEDGTYKIDVNEIASADVTYILTATIKDTAGNTTTLVYNHKLPKIQELTYAEYAAKEKGDAVIVKGIVVGILSKDFGDSVNGLYLHTEEGGFYIYGMEENPNGKYVIGMEVIAIGEFDNYNGTLEVKNATCEIINATPVAVAPVDLTEAYKAAADLKANSISGKQSMLVTLKGVTISTVGNNGYYYFELDGLKTYMRVSSSICPLNAADTTTFTEGWAAHTGWIANVTGVVSIYNGNFYLQPCDANAVEYVSLP